MSESDHDLPVFDTVGRALREVFTDKFMLGVLTIKTAVAILVLSVVLAILVIFFGAAALGIMSRGDGEPGLAGLGIAVLVGGLFLYFWLTYAFVSLQIAALRKVALEEELTRQYFGSYADLRKSKYCVLYVFLFLPMLLIPLLAGLGAVSAIFIILLVFLMPYLARYKLSLALLATGRAGSLGESWRMTSGNTLRLWGTDIVVLLIEVAVYLLIGLLSFALSVFGFVIGAYLAAVLAGFEGFILGCWMKHFDRRANIPDTAEPATV